MHYSKKYGITAEDIAHIGIYMVEKHDNLRTVLNMMDRKNISAVMVEDSDNLHQYFIISHSDIVRFLNQRHDFQKKMLELGLDIFEQTKARDIMHGPIDVIDKDTSIDQIIQIMHERGFKRIFVGNENKQPIGIITTKDILAWNSEFFRKGSPILLCVLENQSGIILSQKFFRDEFSMELLELFGGSLSAITSITSEVLQKSGNLRVIEKDYYVIMLEPLEDITGVLVVDHQSIDLRRKLQKFIKLFALDYEEDLRKRKIYPGSVNVFKIRDLADIFK